MRARIRRRLLAFYRRHRRDLPWRRTGDPYRIWVAETMLQQTQVATVEARYERFFEVFPTLESLAVASPERVCEQWSGLGYYQRARNLHAAAQKIVAEHGGTLPSDPEVLLTLPGIGPYTAGAVASIAYGRPEPIVDTNAARVLARLFAVGGPPDSTRTRKRLWEIARDLVRGPRPGEFNQALMELGSLVCLPVGPRCAECPVADCCEAYALGRPECFPAAGKRARRRRLEIAFAWIETRAGLWLERRPLDGLWAGLWQLPGEEGPAARERLAERLGRPLAPTGVTIEHALSHRAVTAHVYRAGTGRRLRRSEGLRPWAEPLDAPLSALARKAIEAARPRV